MLRYLILTHDGRRVERKRRDAALLQLRRAVYAMLSADSALDTARGWRLMHRAEHSAFQDFEEGTLATSNLHVSCRCGVL